MNSRQLIELKLYGLLIGKRTWAVNLLLNSLAVPVRNPYGFWETSKAQHGEDAKEGTD
jgi:hypothetical protein